MKSPVELLIKEFSDILGPLDLTPMQDLLLVDAIKRAKEMEKERIIYAHVAGHNAPSSTIKNWDAEQYYNETFKQEEQ